MFAYCGNNPELRQELAETRNKMSNVHHIVPAGNFSSRNKETQRQIEVLHDKLKKAEINRFIDPMNLMLVSAGTHARLHTDEYIARVYRYIMATDGTREQIEGALFVLRIEIAASDIWAYGY